MDSLITAAARALARSDPLGALSDHAPALALRGIATAKRGDLVGAKSALKKAARAFGPREAVARARYIVAEAELALVSRDLNRPAKALEEARATLEAHGIGFPVYATCWRTVCAPAAENWGSWVLREVRLISSSRTPGTTITA
jgi:hypothetical protein